MLEVKGVQSPLEGRLRLVETPFPFVSIPSKGLASAGWSPRTLNEPRVFAMTPAAYARRLLDALGFRSAALAGNDNRRPDELWAGSGAMWLSGHAEGAPRFCPAPLASCAQGAWLALASLASGCLAPDFPAYRLLGERAAIAGLSRRGRSSAGGACHLLDTADGVLALNLAREDDFDLLPAWTEEEVMGLDDLREVLHRRETAPMVERAHLLGLAAAAVAPPIDTPRWVRIVRCAKPRPDRGRTPLVVDLSALWAGPLCGQVLSDCGARVIKVESARRADGARRGPPALFDLLNAGKESIVIDFGTDQGVAVLKALLRHADIVIEAARPRALEQLGIIAEEVVASRPGMVWLSITGYGRRSPQRDWIAYGDDAGVAAGLSWLMGGDRGDPVFCGDAIADPLTGLHGALAAQAAWLQGGGVLLDIALRDVVGWCIGMGPTEPVLESCGIEAKPPMARSPHARAAPPGADTTRVLRELL